MEFFILFYTDKNIISILIDDRQVSIKVEKLINRYKNTKQTRIY